MTVCEICGVKGYSKLLTHCNVCRIAFVHCYCVANVSIRSRKNFNWFCEECDNVNKASNELSPPLRTRSERISFTVDREALRREARRRWKKDMKIQNVEKSDDTNRKTKATSFVLFEDNQEDVKVSITQSLKDSPDVEHKDDEKDYVNVARSINLQQKRKLIDSPSINKRKCVQFDMSNIKTQEIIKKKDHTTFSNIPCGIKIVKRGDINSSRKEQENSQQKSLCIRSAIKHGSNNNVGKKLGLAPKIGVDYDLGLKDEEKKTYSERSQALNKAMKNSLIKSATKNGTQNLGQKIGHGPKSGVYLDLGLKGEKTYSERAEDIFEELKKERHVGSTFPSQLRNSNTPCSIMSHEYFLAQPISDAVWRGSCNIIRCVNAPPLSFGLLAHSTSNKASLRVRGIVHALPNFMNLEVVPKYKAWPKAFESSPPTSDDIALYFLPMDERGEKIYDNMIEQMIDHHLVLTSKTNNNIQLLLFTSRTLPRDQWRYQRKYYMWGMFKSIASNFPTNVEFQILQPHIAKTKIANDKFRPQPIAVMNN